MMERRLIFPTMMFVISGASFAFGIWQYIYARQVQISSANRMASIISTIQDSSVATAKKQEIYARVFQRLPPAPSGFGLDFSGSFASQQVSDSCVNEGQRSVCSALTSSNTDVATVKAVCGDCKP
jgi:hypothetical protein